MTTEQITLEVTKEQKMAIMSFINFNSWEIPVTNAEEPSASASDEGFPIQRHVDGEKECPECFCSPCMTDESKRQMWWPEETAREQLSNAPARKRLYRRFWAMMSNCGAWADPRYLQKKALARRSNTTWHRRELMPKCILDKCRDWLPNPNKIPYMGHKWE